MPQRCAPVCRSRHSGDWVGDERRGSALVLRAPRGTSVKRAGADGMDRVARQLTTTHPEQNKKCLSRETVFLACDGRGQRRLGPYVMTPTVIGPVVPQYTAEVRLAHRSPALPGDAARGAGHPRGAAGAGQKDIRTTALHDVLVTRTLGQRDDLS